MADDAFSRTDRGKGKEAGPVEGLKFPPGKKVIISASVPPLVLELIGTTEKSGLIEYVDRSDIISAGILKELQRAFPVQFDRGLNIMEQYIKDNPDDQKAAKMYNQTRKILGFI